MYADLPLWPLPVLIVGYSVLFTWVFQHTGSSVLLVGLFHTLLNAATPLTSAIAPTQAWELRALVFAGTALLLIAITGPHLMREQHGQAQPLERAIVSAEPAAKV
jgi:hypothetical protein